jgi:hypothetical protein
MNLKKSILAILVAAAAQQAQAGFYVNDDAPVITAANPEQARKAKTVYASFTGTRLSKASRTDLENLGDSPLDADSVAVSVYARNKQQLVAANRRALTVRSWLVRKGVAPDRIKVNAELDPDTDPLDTDIQIVFRSAPQRAIADTLRAARFVPPAVAIPLPIANAQAQSQNSDSARLDFVKKIMSMAASKMISQESAVRLVGDYLANLGPNAAPLPQTPATGVPSQSGSAIQPVPSQIVPFGEVPRVWTLAANRSLRDNLKDWAATAGYGEPNWTASNPYQVTYTSTYTGTFFEVLNQVASAVPTVDFRVSKNRRTIDVVDAHQ